MGGIGGIIATVKAYTEQASNRQQKVHYPAAWTFTWVSADVIGNPSASPALLLYRKLLRDFRRINHGVSNEPAHILIEVPVNFQPFY